MEIQYVICYNLSEQMRVIKERVWQRKLGMKSKNERKI